MMPFPWIYVAAPWIHRNEARKVRDRLVAAGYYVTSRWLDVDEHKTTQAEEALHDIADVEVADIMVLLNISKSEGKAVEQGMAIAWGKPIYVIGNPAEKLNVFQHSDDHYTWSQDVDALLEKLSTLRLNPSV